MIKVDIINEVSRAADITKVRAEVAVEAVLEAMKDSLMKGERIELRGFGVRVSAAGLKSFIVQYRTPEGRHRRRVIGRYGLMTVEQARDRLLPLLKKGGDAHAQ